MQDAGLISQQVDNVLPVPAVVQNEAEISEQ